MVIKVSAPFMARFSVFCYFLFDNQFFYIFAFSAAVQHQNSFAHPLRARPSASRRTHYIVRNSGWSARKRRTRVRKRRTRKDGQGLNKGGGSRTRDRGRGGRLANGKSGMQMRPEMQMSRAGQSGGRGTRTGSERTEIRPHVLIHRIQTRSGIGCHLISNHLSAICGPPHRPQPRNDGRLPIITPSPPKTRPQERTMMGPQVRAPCPQYRTALATKKHSQPTSNDQTPIGGAIQNYRNMIAVTVGPSAAVCSVK